MSRSIETHRQRRDYTKIVQYEGMTKSIQLATLVRSVQSTSSSREGSEFQRSLKTQHKSQYALRYLLRDLNKCVHTCMYIVSFEHSV